jgi:hypothetical protein
MTKNILSVVLEKLVAVAKEGKIKLVLMGGIATNIFGRPRTTYDIDGMIFLRENDLNFFLGLLKKQGFIFNQKQPVKFIQGLPFITFYYPVHKTYVDIFVAKTEFQHNILKRARKIKFGKMDLYVISPEDLILVKLQTARERDMQDITEIILENKSKLDFIYLEKWAKLLNVNIFLKDELRSLGLDRIRPKE